VSVRRSGVSARAPLRSDAISTLPAADRTHRHRRRRRRRRRPNPGVLARKIQIPKQRTFHDTAGPAAAAHQRIRFFSSPPPPRPLQQSRAIFVENAPRAGDCMCAAMEFSTARAIRRNAPELRVNRRGSTCRATGGGGSEK